MTPEEFRSLLDTYGADLTRWPHAKRQNAHRYLQDSVEAQDAFVEAQEFDALLSSSEPVLTDSVRHNLLDSIMDDLPDRPDLARAPRARKPDLGAMPKPTQMHNTPVGIKSVLVRPLTPLLAACLAFGICVGVAISVKYQYVLAQSNAQYNQTVLLYDLR